MTQLEYKCQSVHPAKEKKIYIYVDMQPSQV